jgi:hypothetical protein
MQTNSEIESDTPQYRPFLSVRSRKTANDPIIIDAMAAATMKPLDIVSHDSLSDHKIADLSDVWNRALLAKSEMEREMYSKQYSNLQFPVEDDNPHPLCPSTEIVVKFLKRKYPESQRLKHVTEK